MTSPVCPRCGTPRQPAWRICPQCGLEFPPPPAAVPPPARRGLNWMGCLFVLGLLVVAVGCYIAYNIMVGFAAVPLPPTAAPAARGPMPRRIENLVAIAPNPILNTNGTDAAVTVRLVNKDSAAHTVQVQANFYRVPTAQLGADPADALITAGTARITLAAGGVGEVTVHALNLKPEIVRGVDFDLSEP